MRTILQFKRYNKRKKSKFEFGASLVEYGLLIGLIAVVAMLSIREVGWRTSCRQMVASALIGMQRGTAYGSFDGYLFSWGNCRRYFHYSFHTPQQIAGILNGWCNSYSTYTSQQTNSCGGW